MPDGLIDTAAQSTASADRRIFGVAVAQVIENVDSTGQGRVKLRLPWLPGVEPWARVAVLMAGPDRGTFFIPQVDDEVLVAFNHGDVREPYVIGSLWNGQDRPPAVAATDPITKRIIRTPLGHEIELDDAAPSVIIRTSLGHEIELDDAAQSINVTSSTQQKISIDPMKIELTTTGGAATIRLDTLGNVSIQAMLSVQLLAPRVVLGGGSVEFKSDTGLDIKAMGTCNIEAPLVRIN